MQALVFDRPGSAVVRDIERPRLGAGEVLVRPTTVGICHSDLELLAGDYFLPTPWPVVPGHEWTGVVEEVADPSLGFAPGDPVVGECAVAADAHVGFTLDGGASQFMVADASWLHLLPGGFDATLGALVEPFTVAFAATEGVDASDDVVVLGGGPIGLCAVAAARGRGARVILVDPHKSRRALGATLGADVVCDPRTEDVSSIVREATLGRMGTHVVEAAGKPAAVADALQLSGLEATVTTLGISVGGTAEAELGLIMSKALTVKGQVGSAGVWPDAIRFLERVGPDLSQLVSEEYQLADGVEALTAAARKDTIKVHIQVGDPSR